MDARTRHNATAQLITKTQQLSAWLIDDHLVVAEFPQTTLRLYNSSAAAIWLTLLEQTKTTLYQVLNKLVLIYDINPEIIKLDVKNLLAEWCQLGWLQDAGDTYGFNQNLSAYPAQKEQVFNSIQLSNSNYHTQSWVVQLSIPLKIELHVDSHSSARLVFDRLSAMLEGLPTSDHEPAHILRGVIHQQRFSIFYNGHCLIDADNHVDGMGQFLYQMIALGHPQEKCLLSLHAAALSNDYQKGIIFPGLSGAGKSTLAVLLTNMGWNYMGDDIVGMGVSGNILALPTAASLKFFDIDALQQYKDQFNVLATIRYGDKVAKYLPILKESINTLPSPLSAWVFPQYSIGQRFICETLKPVGTLQQLIESGIGFTENLTYEEIELFLKYLEEVPAYRISYSDIQQVAQWLKTL